MSGCADVCIDMGYDGENDFFSQSVVKARKSYHCEECGEQIGCGVLYERSTGGKFEGDIWTAHTCLLCKEIRDAFVCGSYIFGELFREIEEVMFPIWNEHGPIDCLAKLKTKEARDEVRHRYKEWESE